MLIGIHTSALAAALMASSAPTVAEAPLKAQAVNYRVPAGPLSAALPIFAEQSGEQILYSTHIVGDRRTSGVSGAMTSEAALTALLRGTGLSARRASPTVQVVFDPSARAELNAPAQVEDIVVTGSLIRGVRDGPSPVLSISRDAMDREGRATVAQLLASLPQNFGGTANEGALNNGGDRSGTNSTYANGVNLRGLGSDATLVLLNGRRLSGTGAKGDFVDVSTIPTAAVERVDVLLDGASALYGQDVAQDIVANCGLEIVFAPKELRVAQDLSERLGFYGYRARSRSRPVGLGQGRRSLSESEHKRALMLPQELMQLPSDRLIVLKVGLPPTRGRKLVYYRDRRFSARLRRPPTIRPAPPPAGEPMPNLSPDAAGLDDMDFDSIVRRFTSEGLTPPAPGATESEVEAWLARLVEAPALPQSPRERS